MKKTVPPPRDEDRTESDSMKRAVHEAIGFVGPDICKVGTKVVKGIRRSTRTSKAPKQYVQEYGFLNEKSEDFKTFFEEDLVSLKNLKTPDREAFLDGSDYEEEDDDDGEDDEEEMNSDDEEAIVNDSDYESDENGDYRPPSDSDESSGDDYEDDDDDDTPPVNKRARE